MYSEGGFTRYSLAWTKLWPVTHAKQKKRCCHKFSGIGGIKRRPLAHDAGLEGNCAIFERFYRFNETKTFRLLVLGLLM